MLKDAAFLLKEQEPLRRIAHFFGQHNKKATLELCGNDTGMNLSMQTMKPSQGAEKHRGSFAKK